MLLLNQKKFKNLMSITQDSSKMLNVLRVRKNIEDFEMAILQDYDRIVYLRADYTSAWIPDFENKQLHVVIELGDESRLREAVDLCFEPRRLQKAESSLLSVLTRHRQDFTLELLIYELKAGRKGPLVVRNPYKAISLRHPVSPDNIIGAITVTGLHYSSATECLMLFGQYQIDEVNQARGVMMTANPPKPKVLLVARYDCGDAFKSTDSTKQFLLRPSWQYGYQIPHVASQLTGQVIPLIITASEPINGVSFIFVAARLTNLCLVFKTFKESPRLPTELSLVHRKPLTFDSILRYRGSSDGIEIESVSLIDTYSDSDIRPAKGSSLEVTATVVFNKTYLAQMFLKPMKELEV